MCDVHAHASPPPPAASVWAWRGERRGWSPSRGGCHQRMARLTRPSSPGGGSSTAAEWCQTPLPASAARASPVALQTSCHRHAQLLRVVHRGHLPAVSRWGWSSMARACQPRCRCRKKRSLKAAVPATAAWHAHAHGQRVLIRGHGRSPGLQDQAIRGHGRSPGLQDQARPTWTPHAASQPCPVVRQTRPQHRHDHRCLHHHYHREVRWHLPHPHRLRPWMTPTMARRPHRRP